MRFHEANEAKKAKKAATEVATAIVVRAEVIGKSTTKQPFKPM